MLLPCSDPQRSEQRASDLLKIGDPRVDDLLRHAEIFCKTRLAHIFRGIAVDQPAVNGDLVMG